MTDWQPITPMEPEGNGMVMIWCSDTNLVRLTAATRVVGRSPVDIEPPYHFTHFAYIDHPYPIPKYHPYYELKYHPRALEVSITEKDHQILEKTIGNCGETYAMFVSCDAVRYYCGQIDAKTKWMRDNATVLLFKTKEECLLAEIAIAKPVDPL